MLLRHAEATNLRSVDIQEHEDHLKIREACVSTDVHRVQMTSQCAILSFSNVLVLKRRKRIKTVVWTRMDADAFLMETKRHTFENALVLDCLESAFHLKTRLVLISASAVT